MITNVLVGTVVLIHLYIMCFEMFAWKQRGPKVFTQFPKDLFPKTTILAANQGLYNGFLSAGLVWSLLIQDPFRSDHVAIFFLSCVIIAGTYGALTAERKIFLVQAVPALIAIYTILL